MLTQTPDTTEKATPPTTARVNADWMTPGLFRFGEPLLDLRDRIDRVFDSVFGGDPQTYGWFGRRDALPKVDVAETDGMLTLTADLPGMTEADVELTVGDGVLTLSGERKAESDRTDKNYRVIERSHGRFTRAFQLPDGVDVDKISARFDKGVLTVALPKNGQEVPAVKRIAIENGAS